MLMRLICINAQDAQVQSICLTETETVDTQFVVCMPTVSRHFLKKRRSTKYRKLRL